MKRNDDEMIGTQTKVKPLARWPQAVVKVGCVLASVWLTLGFIASLILAIQAPVSTEMLHMASWLGPKSTALHFTSGHMATLVSITAMIIGLGIAGVKSSPWLAISPLAIVLVVLFGSSEEAYVRIGVLKGTVKIGCYVEISAECAQQMGIENKGFPSRYMPRGSSKEAGQWSDWYRSERRLVVNDALEHRASMLTMPLVPFLIAPLYMLEGETVEGLMNAQLEEAKRLRTSLVSVK